jgi:hypothetical protein
VVPFSEIEFAGGPGRTLLFLKVDATYHPLRDRVKKKMHRSRIFFRSALNAFSYIYYTDKPDRRNREYDADRPPER